MKVLAYRGVGIISRAIRFQTRSVYSHVAIQMAPDRIYEAWHTTGVRCIADPWEGHDNDTIIDVFELTVACDLVAVERFLKSQIGKGYDFRSVVRFLTRKKPRDADSDIWFCSEYLLSAVSFGGVDLLHINASEASPRDVTITPLMRYKRQLQK